MRCGSSSAGVHADASRENPYMVFGDLGLPLQRFHSPLGPSAQDLSEDASARSTAPKSRVDSSTLTSRFVPALFERRGKRSGASAQHPTLKKPSSVKPSSALVT